MGEQVSGKILGTSRVSCEVLAVPRRDCLIVASKVLFISREIEGKIAVEGVLVFYYRFFLLLFLPLTLYLS